MRSQSRGDIMALGQAKKSHTLKFVFIISCSYFNLCLVGRTQPILILNRATQCYFNAGLQCIFATTSFAPWITTLPEKCLPTNPKDKKLIAELRQLTIKYNSPSILWADNAELFQAIQAIDPQITPDQQEDVISIMAMILQRLPILSGCKNPFIMNMEISEQIKAPGRTEQKRSESQVIWQTEPSIKAQTNLVDVLQQSFFTTTEVTLDKKEYPKTTHMKITAYPLILCCGITPTLQAEKGQKTVKYLESISIPDEFFLGATKIQKQFILDGQQAHYKLIGIAWRTTPTPGSSEGHYFATVQYRTSWYNPTTWYILDEIERYTSVASPYDQTAQETNYDVDNLPPTDTLKIHTDQENKNLRKNKKLIHEWTNRTITRADLARAMNDGFLEVAGAKALPTLVVYERQGNIEEEEKEKKAGVPTQALSESLQNLQRDLATLSALMQ